MISLLEDIQEYVAGLLRTKAAFAGFDVVTRKRGNIVSQVEESIARIGAAIVVLPPRATVSTEVQGPEFERIELAITCFENPVINTTGRSALAVAEQVHAHLHLHTPRIDGVTSPILSARDAIVPIDEDTENNVITANLYLAGGLVSRANDPS